MNKRRLNKAQEYIARAIDELFFLIEEEKLDEERSIHPLHWLESDLQRSMFRLSDIYESEIDSGEKAK